MRRKAQARRVREHMNGPDLPEGKQEDPTGTHHPARAVYRESDTHGSPVGGEPKGHLRLADNGNLGARANHADLTRRDFLRLTGLVAASAVAVACGAPGVSTLAPAGTAVTEPPFAITGIPAGETATALLAEAPPAAPAATREVPRGQVSELPRERTFIFSITSGDVGIGNPYAPGYTHQHGHAALMEPLYFFRPSPPSQTSPGSPRATLIARTSRKSRSSCTMAWNGAMEHHSRARMWSTPSTCSARARA